MSTNYYLHKEPYGPRHIGKTWYGGIERGPAFTWAIDPDAFDQIAVDHDPDAVEVRDEYGKPMTLSAFRADVLVHIKHHETEYVGKEFS